MKENLIISYQNKEIGEIKGFIDKKGEPWFYASKVCDCLKIKNTADALKGIKERHNKYGDKGVGISYTLVDTEKGRQRVTIVDEKTLYELIFRSNTKKAFDFQQWVFGEVLPTLRKHGEYRIQGKMIRRSLTDTIKTEIADKTDSINEKKFCYSNFTKLINKSLGLSSSVDRSTLDDETLERIARRENLVQSMLAEGRSYNEIKTYLKEYQG